MISIQNRKALCKHIRSLYKKEGWLRIIDLFDLQADKKATYNYIQSMVCFYAGNMGFMISEQEVIKFTENYMRSRKLI